MPRRPADPSPPRPDWRDPNMPVYRNYLMGNGERRVWVDPEYEHRYREHMVQAALAPHWSRDPTYDLRRKR